MESRVLIESEVQNTEQTEKFVAQTLIYLKPGDTVLLYGKLGSGKTLLTKLFAKKLGIDSEVSSPTFSLINRYDGEITINHLDLYRISHQKDLINLGLEDILEAEHCINFIEWPQLIEKIIHWPHFRIEIETDVRREMWRLFRLLHLQ